MLVRAAGRNRRHYAPRQLAADFQQLYLPFLCPAQLRWNATRPANTLPDVRKVSAHSRPEKHQSRHLASIAGTSDYGHLNATSDTQYGTSTEPPNLHWNYPRASQPHEFLLLKHEREELQKPPSYRHGIGGSSTDLLQNLHTCLRVNRFERAETIIKRLETYDDTTTAELVHAHETYLEARFQELTAFSGDKEHWDAMEGWFNAEIIAKKVNVGERTWLVMILGAMAALNGKARDEAVRDLVDISGISRSIFLDSPDLDDVEHHKLAAILSETVPDSSHLAAIEEEANVKTRIQEQEEALAFDRLPAILQVSQKGMGLEALKDSLSVLETSLPAQPLLADQDDHTSELDKKVAYERERLVEESAAMAAVRRWQAEEENLRAVGIDSNLQRRSLGALMWQWYSALLPKIKEELQNVRKALDSKEPGQENEDRRLYGAQLESVSADTIAATTILTIMSLVSRGKDRDTDEPGGPIKLTAATHALGRAIQQESNACDVMKHAEAARKKRARTALKAGKRGPRNATRQQKVHAAALEWPLDVKVKIGAVLISKLIESSHLPVTRKHPRTKEQVTQVRPAFSHKTLYHHGKKQGYFVQSPELLEKVHREPQGGLICKRLPMIVEPIPWTGFDDGGYLNYSTPFVRFPITDQTPKDYAIAAINKGDMKQVFDAINVLSRVPWQINEDVLRVQIDAWNSGEAVGNFAPLHPQLDWPLEPAPSSDPNLRKKWLSDVKDVENKRAGLHSQRCHQNFQLEIARAFRNETIYFPHNIDFRGRAYPVPPYLNHMGADNARAVLRFARGKELGVRGLRWLKIHLANVFGYDKASLQEREDFVMEHLAEIYDSAANPLSGKRWWTRSEDAWQTLAACCELRDALESPDPTKFVSHLPVHQDGTCNGLQHYAALGGDEIGARQVNLEPSDRPSDVYTAVAEAVKSGIEKDFNEGHPVAQILHGKITRKVVKQPVMTNVYGVTFYGAKEQVKKQLVDIFPDVPKSALINHTIMAAYITGKIFTSLGEMFRGAQDIQEWLGKCADRISTCITSEQIAAILNPPQNLKKPRQVSKPTKKLKVSRASSLLTAKGLFKSSVIWTTPMRFPVVQPYRTPRRQMVKTSMQAVALQEPQTWDPVSRRKQLQAFPPNFIHSLDATHMMLSAIKSEERGMTFASIHDSFWTHACDVDDLSEILRDAFVHMHSENIVGRLRQEFIARYQGSMHLAIIHKNSKAGKAIKSQLLRFQLQRKEMAARLKWPKVPQYIEELLVEHERLRLLASSDPVERKQGEEMVTPSSIFASEPDESAFALPAEFEDSLLGSMPDGVSVEDAYEESQAGLDDTNDDTVNIPEDDLDTDADVDSHLLEASEDDPDAETNVNQTLSAARQALLDPAATTKAGREKKQELNKKRSRAYAQKVFLWLPLTFPEVPDKGTFDVSRLKQSRYFFH